MGKTEKLLSRFRAARGPFKWDELVAVLRSLGFEQIEGAGSRVCFVRGSLDIHLHKPHPQKEVKAYAVKQVQAVLRSEGLL